MCVLQSRARLTEHDMLAVEEAGALRAQEELAPVRVRPRVGHAEDTLPSVAQLEILVRELVAVDGPSACGTLAPLAVPASASQQVHCSLQVLAMGA